jgi:hypothetical protein
MVLAATAVRTTVVKALRVGKAACHRPHFTAYLIKLPDRNAFQALSPPNLSKREKSISLGVSDKVRVQTIASKEKVCISSPQDCF